MRETPYDDARRAPLDEPAPTVLSFHGGWSDIAPEAPRGSLAARGAPRQLRHRDRGSGDAVEASGDARPPFAVPSMAEINQIEPNGLTVASTFAGAGGSSTGWQLAGYRVLWANEFFGLAADSYAANHPTTIIDRRDIRQIRATEIVEACGGVVPDVLDGSPPCQDFSMAGKRSRGWGEVRSHGDGTVQRSDDLFAQYTRILSELKPRAFVAENVKGLVTGTAKGQFKRIMAGLTDAGYRVRAKVLDAQWLGVPQRRQRVIIIGLRADLGLDPVFPKPLPYRYSMLDACPWLDRFDAVRLGDGFDDETHTLEAPIPTITAAPVGRDRWEVRRLGTGHRHVQSSVDEPVATIGARLNESQPHLQRPAQRGLAFVGHNYHAGHIDDIDGPTSTITSAGVRGASWGEVLIDDGLERRRLTIPEVKRLCSFPDDYVLVGKFQDQWARLGNSVPPLMMAAVGRALVPLLTGASVRN